jgi:porin
VVYEPAGGPVLALSVFDTNDTPTTSGFETFFDNGAVVHAIVTLPIDVFGLPGHHGVEAAYSSGRYTNFQESPYLDPVGDLVFPAAPKRGSWAVAYQFDQAVAASPDDPDRVWGVFGRVGLADDNPNPIRWTWAGGLAGASPVPGRAADSFGVGYYYLGVSDALRRGARPLTPLGAEHGVEVYYNARVTPWCQITPDLQIIDPFQREANSAFVLGLRARVDF